MSDCRITSHCPRERDQTTIRLRVATEVLQKSGFAVLLGQNGGQQSEKEPQSVLIHGCKADWRGNLCPARAAMNPAGLFAHRFAMPFSLLRGLIYGRLLSPSQFSQMPSISQTNCSGPTHSGLSRNRVSVPRDSGKNDAFAVRMIQAKWDHLRLAGLSNQDLFSGPRIH